MNGSAHQLKEGQSLSELVDVLGLSSQAIAVAVNRAIVARPLWTTYVLSQNDKVDVVRAIGGG
ncbi:sulfur carrier protein ThiS [Undibacterium terreum]|uniref:sulfur carrier protein ThiS n=1 Tax=Undibacterium terreum TaxID=1224302 RepID=UPI00280A5062|nr:sulfur carrier protein ThiS [Undibacterium terreum]